MMFPLSKEEWYQKRDDRTKRIDGASGFEEFKLGVVISPHLGSSYAIQVMTATSLNLLARWCRHMVIQMPDVPSVFPGLTSNSLKEAIRQQLLNIDPFGSFEFTDVNASECSQIMYIGLDQKTALRGELWIDSSGWIASIGRDTPQTFLGGNNNLNPTGPAFASCLGVAELFRQAVGITTASIKPTWYSLYDYSISNNPLNCNNPNYVPGFDFGRIQQIGCGAVGSSLDILLSFTDWQGTIDLIDFDKVDVSNCNRSLAFSAYDAVNSRKKVDVCTDIFKDKLRPVKFDGAYIDFVKAGKFVDLPPDLILCLANEQNVWSTIQSNIPPLTLHATTTPNWAVNFGRHITKKEWCILCRFAEAIEHNFTPICAEGVIKASEKKEETIQGVLPFLSTTAAVLILAEMAKLPLPNYPVNSDFIEFSTRTPGAEFQQLQRTAEATCDCTSQPTLEHLTKSKFWKLSK
jgi:ThiF family